MESISFSIFMIILTILGGASYTFSIITIILSLFTAILLFNKKYIYSLISFVSSSFVFLIYSIFILCVPSYNNLDFDSLIYITQLSFSGFFFWTGGFISLLYLVQIFSDINTRK